MTFPISKSQIGGQEHHFETTEGVQTALTQAIKAITKEEFLGCYKQWKIRWNKCVQFEGAYFEGDHIDVA